MTSEAMMNELLRYDTPSISNVIATFPNQETCLGLYNPWEGRWYTDETLRCMFPEHGRRVGRVVTAVYGMPDGFNRLGFGDILNAIAAVDGPVILAIKQNFPEHIRRRNGLLGGNMLTAYKKIGVRGILTDGPSRDLEEIRPLGIQCMFTGLSPAHGPFSVQAVNVPVSICGMDLCPGEIVHMDENGAVKFAENQLERIVANVALLSENEERKKQAMLSAESVAELALAFQKK